MPDHCPTFKPWRDPANRPAPLAPGAWPLDLDTLVGIACVAIIVLALWLA